MGLIAGVIGLGRIGAQWDLSDSKRLRPSTHVGAWRLMPTVDKVVAFDVDASKVASMSKFGPKVQPAMYLDLLEKCDIVSVATPAETHAEVVENLFDHCKPKLVFCEKPIATTIEDAKRVIDACAKGRAKVAINHTRRWDPVWKYAAIETLGDVREPPNMAVANFTGDLMNVGVHMADLLNWFKLGSCCEVFGHRDAEYVLFELDIFFQRKRVRVRDNGLAAEVFVTKESERYDGTMELGLDRSLDAPKVSPMATACEQLSQCVYEDAAPACTGEDGLKALERVISWEKRVI